MDETKENQISNAFAKLVTNLEELTKFYRTLLDLLRKEKEFLVQSDLAALNESNKAKETMLLKIRAHDSARERYAKEFAHLIGTDVSSPRLLEMAQKIQGPEADRLRSIHSTLDLLIRRVSELNKENETFASHALQVLGGAMGEIKDTLSPKKTYERKGKMTHGPERAGNFVSKEA